MGANSNSRTTGPAKKFPRRLLLVIGPAALGAATAGVVLSRQGKRNLETVFLSDDEPIVQRQMGPVKAPALPESYADIPTITFDEAEGVDKGEYFPVVTSTKTLLLKYVERAGNFLTFYDPVELREFSVELSPDREGGFVGSLNIGGIEYKILTSLDDKQPFLFDADGDGEFGNKINTHYVRRKVLKDETLSSILSPLFYLCHTNLGSQRQYGNVLDGHVRLNEIRNPPTIIAGNDFLIDLEALSVCERSGK